LKFSGDNLLVIINDILDFSKIEAGKIELEEIDISLPGFLRSIKETFVGKSAEKKLELRLEQGESLPEVIKGDPVRLSQILNNLMSNAIKFTETGSVALRIQQVSRTDTHHRIRFEVEDSGMGIPEEKLTHIFSSFTQSNSSTTRIFGGTGLGLAISKSLVELYEGKLEVRSELGVGSCFSFEIEMKRSLTEHNPLAKQTVGLIDEPSQNLNGTHILLVEDNKINQIVVSRYLEKWGCTFSIAENGAEAMAKVQEESFSLVLMDLHMPIMDGYQATRGIRTLPDSRYQFLPIIALTASAMLPVRREVELAGMNGYVSKPFQPDELFDTIDKWRVAPELP
jgi:CheY-like chemotaxis protein